MAFSDLTTQITKLQSKPGHETVKHLLCNILKEQLGATDDEIALEDNLKIVCKGRIGLRPKSWTDFGKSLV